jgi:hypothetical protein
VVRLNEEAGPIKADLAAGARLIRLDGDKEEAVALMELNRREAEPRVLEGKMTGLPAGKYAVELVIPELADKVRTGAGEPGRPDKPLRAEFTQLPPESREMIDLETRWPLLQQLAGASGGRVFTPETAHELADLLAQQRLTEVQHSETALWQVQVKDKEKGEWRWQWPAIAFLIAVTALLTLEWVGRKWSGLP